MEDADWSASTRLPGMRLDSPHWHSYGLLLHIAAFGCAAALTVKVAVGAQRHQCSGAVASVGNVLFGRLHLFKVRACAPRRKRAYNREPTGSTGRPPSACCSPLGSSDISTPGAGGELPTTNYLLHVTFDVLTTCDDDHGDVEHGST